MIWWTAIFDAFATAHCSLASGFQELPMSMNQAGTNRLQAAAANSSHDHWVFLSF
jgi:hypothetical protein